MNAAAIKNIINLSLPEITTSTKIAMSYLSAYTTSILAVGLLYMLGVFDVGFLSSESIAVKLFKYVNIIAS